MSFPSVPAAVGFGWPRGREWDIGAFPMHDPQPHQLLPVGTSTGKQGAGDHHPHAGAEGCPGVPSPAST